MSKNRMLLATTTSSMIRLFFEIYKSFVDIKEKSNNIPELQSPFEQLREIDADGKELRKSYTLC